MIPCLYKETETAFTSNGIGKLCDCISCLVTEKRNGAYELKMTYPSDGIHAEEIIEDRIILARPAERTSYQPFRIYKITTPLTGILEIAARHIQYRQNFITVSPFSANGIQEAMVQLKAHATTDCPFGHREPGGVYDHGAGDDPGLSWGHGREFSGRLRRGV